MIIEFKPSVLKGKVMVPSSKSIAHRALICAAFSDGVSLISGLSRSEDVNATISCLENIGARIEYNEKEKSALIYGKGAEDFNRKVRLDCGESGSTLRFLIPLCAVLGIDAEFCGKGRLMSRPLDEYKRIFDENGLTFELEEEKLHISGKLKGGKIKVRCDKSSQFISGLMLASPLLAYATELIPEGDISSVPYILLTADVMRSFGADVDITEGKIIISENNYKANNFEVPPDYSSAAYFTAMQDEKNEIEIPGLENVSLQADAAAEKYFEKIKAGYTVLSVKDCPDLAPLLMCVGALYKGVKLTDTKRLEYKESNRGIQTAKELCKFGADVKVSENEIEVLPSALHKPTQSINSHNDHRIAMSMSVLLTKLGGTLDGAEAVSKSYPDFFTDLKGIGADINKTGI